MSNINQLLFKKISNYISSKSEIVPQYLDNESQYQESKSLFSSDIEMNQRTINWILTISSSLLKRKNRSQLVRHLFTAYCPSNFRNKASFIVHLRNQPYPIQ